MERRLVNAAILLLLAVAGAPATQSTQPPGQKETATQKEGQPAAKSRDDVVRISVTLVQIDAVVVDKQGRQVTDLKAEDFELAADGRAQHITNFTYVAEQPAPSVVAKPPGKLAPPVTGAGLTPDQTRRTMALVVDDLGLSFESTTSVRQALKKFVDEQMQPGDLVAIVRTGVGIGALQQFTADKRLLYAAIERVRWNPNSGGGISAFAPLETDPVAADRADQGLPVPPSQGEAARLREDLFAVGTLGTLNFVVRGLKDLPGRKSVILFSDGFRLLNRAGGTQRVLDALRRLTDQANRASVVVYTIDARGVQPIGFSAEDSLGDLHPATYPDRLEARLADRREQFIDSQDGLNYLAQQTGGFFVRNRNDLGAGLARVLQDQSGFYLLGYVPDDSVFKTQEGRQKFHKLTVKVKRPGLSVRSRTGFYGIADEEARPVLRTHAEQMLGALLSPFSAGDVHLRLTSLFGDDPKAGSFLRSLLHIEGRDISFAEEPDGWRKGVVDVVLVTFGERGNVVDQINRTYTVRVKEDAYRELQRGGLVYTLNLPIQKPGAYQLRAAVRDATTERSGSASQFVDVPDLTKERLSLSGIVLQGRDADSLTQPLTPAESTVSDQSQNDSGNPQASPAVRRFTPGMVLDYSFLIFNAQPGPTTRAPQLETQMLLFRDGQKVVTGEVTRFDPGQQEDWKRITANGRLHLAKGVKSGEYVLQIIVTDKLADAKRRTTAQWIDFEIVR